MTTPVCNSTGNPDLDFLQVFPSPDSFRAVDLLSPATTTLIKCPQPR